jgi:hypothetical protein
MIRKVVTITCSAAALATAIVWIASHWAFLNASCSLMDTSRQVHLEASLGELSLTYQRQDRVPASPGSQRYSRWWDGFGYRYSARAYDQGEYGIYAHRMHKNIFPVWALFVVFSVFPGVVFTKRKLLPMYRRWVPAAHRRWRSCCKGCCKHCGYNLTGNVSGVCPECGQPISSMSSRRSG